jgi:hypothetical protein
VSAALPADKNGRKPKRAKIKTFLAIIPALSERILLFIAQIAPDAKVKKSSMPGQPFGREISL